MDLAGSMIGFVAGPPPAVIPVLVGPMYALFAILPAIAVAVGRALWQLLGPRGLWRTAQLIWRQKLPLALLAACVVGLVYVWPYVFPTVAANTGKAEAGSDWTVFRGGPDRRGFRPGEGDPAQGKVAWSFTSGDIRDFYSSPALVGNRVYIASAKYEFFKDRGSIFCVDADKGTLVWEYKKNYRSTFSSPSVKGKYLVVGEGLHLIRNARVVCLDVEASARKGEGVKLWEYATKSHVESCPCLFDDKAVVGAGDDGLYCFALEPDKNGNARVIWHLEGKDYPDCETSPVYHDGKVYWGLGNEGQAIVCVEANTGKEIWKIPTPSPVFGSPTIAGGRLYAGMGFGDFVNSSDQVAANLRKKLADEKKTPRQIQEAVSKIKREGEIWCVNLADHKVLWTYSVGQVVLGSVAADGNSLYAVSRDGKAYCLSTEGKLLGSFDMHEPLMSSPAVGQDCAYVISVSGRVVGLDKKRMTLVWDVPLNVPSFSSPAVGRGHLYVGTSGSGLLCLGRPGREVQAPFWPGAMGGAGRSGWIDDSLVPENADYVWGFGSSESNEAAGGPVQSPAARVGTSFYVGVGKGLAKLSCGKDLLTKPAEQWRVPSANPVSLSAAGTDRNVFFVDGKIGDAGRCLHCLDTSGKELWRRPVESDASGEFFITRERLLIAESRNGLTCLDIRDPAKVQEAWKAPIGPTVGAPCLAEEIVLASVQSPGSVVALDLESGARLWEQALPSPPATHPVLAGGRVWVGDESGLAAYSLVRGESSLSVPCGALQPALAVRGERLAAVTRKGDLLLVDAASGKVLPTLGKVEGGIPPILTDDAVLYLTKGSIQRYDLRTGQSALWTKITPSWPGNILSPMIVANSCVVFATDEEGLVCMKPRKQ